MEIKVIVSDIDGTLLNDERNISPQTRETLIQAQKMGCKLILASGRPLNGMKKYVKELEMDKYEGILIAYNGAMIVDCKTNEVLFSQQLSKENCKNILKHLEQFNVVPMIDKENYLYVHNVYRSIRMPNGNEQNIVEYEARAGDFLLCEEANLSNFVDFPLSKILVAGEPDYLESIYQDLAAPFEDISTIAFSAPFFVEYVDKGLNKAKGLSIVLKKFNIAQENVIAFGDGHNDKDLIAYAGIGVAMQNAVDDLKAIANKQALSNNENGIHHILKEYI